MGQTVRILRRAAALALAVTAVWVAVRAAPLSNTAQTLQTLGADVRFAVALLQTQLPPTTRTDGQQRLILSQSPLLHAVRFDQSRAPVTESADPVGSATDSEDDVPLSPGMDGPVEARTFAPSASQSYLHRGDIYIADRAGKNPDLSALPNSPVRLGEGPHILIIHTHASEAYTPAAGETYTPSDPYRTTDCNHNMVRVGEEMAQVLRQGGLDVLHDTTLYDYPAYDGAYDRSRQAVERWLAQYPSIRVVLDVHRDALSAEDGTVYKAVSQEKGGPAAQIMLVVGTDGKGDHHPLWQENLRFAMDLQQQMLDDWEQLARPMVLRSSRFNQHLRAGSVLVEVGTHGNTLSEALAGARLFAQSALSVLCPSNPA